MNHHCTVRACVFPMRKHGLCLPHLRELTLSYSLLDCSHGLETFASPEAREGFSIRSFAFPAGETREAHAARARKYRTKIRRDPGRWFMHRRAQNAAHRRWRQRQRSA
jgi:hypothetical protein